MYVKCSVEKLVQVRLPSTGCCSGVVSSGVFAMQPQHRSDLSVLPAPASSSLSPSSSPPSSSSCSPSDAARRQTPHIVPSSKHSTDLSKRITLLKRPKLPRGHPPVPSPVRTPYQGNQKYRFNRLLVEFVTPSPGQEPHPPVPSLKERERAVSRRLNIIAFLSTKRPSVGFGQNFLESGGFEI